MNIEFWRDVNGRSRYSQPARNLLAFAIETCQQQSVEFTGREVVMDLQSQGAFPGPHRPKAEAQRPHRSED